MRKIDHFDISFAIWKLFRSLELIKPTLPDLNHTSLVAVTPFPDVAASGVTLVAGEASSGVPLFLTWLLLVSGVAGSDVPLPPPSPSD